MNTDAQDLKKEGEFQEMETEKKGKMKAIVVVTLLAVGLYFSFGKNDAEEYSVVQKWPSGNLDIVTEAGLYWA